MESAVRSDKFAMPAWECDKNIVPRTTSNQVQHQVVPVRLQVMLCLCHLATGEPFASVAMAGHSGRDTVRHFFHRFTAWMVDFYFDYKVTGPSGIGFKTVADVEKAELISCKLGLLSIATCVDGVHVACDRAPFDVKYKFVAKEGYQTTTDVYWYTNHVSSSASIHWQFYNPTVVWNVHVDAVGVIKYVAPQLFGAANDKTQVRQDKLVQALRTSPLFTKRECSLQGCAQDKVVSTSSLCDCGYHAWLSIISAPKYPACCNEVRWASHCERVRKIMERTFGILKVYFLVLRLPILYNRGNGIDSEQSSWKLDNVFKTCCMLHNWLMLHIWLDTMGTQSTNWMQPSPDETKDQQRIYNLAVSL